MLNADKKQVEIASEFQEQDHSHPFQPQAIYAPFTNTCCSHFEHIKLNQN